METHTADMQVAGFLVATGHPLMRIDDTGRRKVFIFPRCDEAVQDFYNGHGTVNARELFDAYYKIKDTVFGNRRS